ncbi:LysR family transcriptional regulator [Xenorhabdus cabanillasii]|uniref:LysR family transcriptional regulator n=1 Tax=Xenorhabdus cabanillasii TaxID=351673 RepID=A0A3D9UGL2_9GAMM|nr:LysR family transcriptional regulator [Xenorhabdus cabanillasii]REF25815.1 LysR family transcriptional regulator [Xenorhabdus cabanillasii]
MDELRRIDLNLLLTLHALLTEKHVTRASLRLHKSQPAISHALAQLRTHFNDPLLIRRNGRMTLTTRSQALIQPLNDALGSLNSLLCTSEFDPSQAHRCFRLSLSDYAARLILPPLVRYVRKWAPGIDLAISQASRETMLAQLADGELDLALGIFPDAPEYIQVQELFPEEFVSLADKAVLPTKGELSLEEWLQRPHVMLALRPDANDEIEKTLTSLGLKRHIALALPHWSVAVELLPGTDLILTVASRILEPMCRYKTLRQFKPPFVLPEFTYQQAWHIRRERDAAHRWLRQAILTCSQSTKTIK